MSSAEQLLNEAQYAFQSISAGKSWENARNAARAKSFCKKIFRKYPGSSEAVVAHGIMMRLGENPFPSKIEAEHQHKDHAEAHGLTAPSPEYTPTVYNKEQLQLDWQGLLAVILATSKTVLAVIGFVGLILFGYLGPMMLLTLLGALLLTTPARQILKPQQQNEINSFIARANAWIKARRDAGRGLT
jgi:hypothetical protein